MKKRNILITVASFLLLGIVLNVNAENTAVDSTKCKDGKVYTNYYFFLEASPSDTGGAGTSQDYTTIGYYKNAVQGSTLTSIVNSKGLMSDEFAQAAQRTRGVVPISTTNPTKSLSIQGVGLQTFYSILTGTATSSGNDTYLVEHNWSKRSGQVVNQTDNYTITFEPSQITSMMSATIMLNKFSIGFVEDSTYTDYPFALQIIRKYSEGFTPTLDNISLITITNNDETTWDAYLQPALYYIQYCENATETTPTTFVVKYDGNAGTDTVKNVPATSSKTNVGTCVNISSDKPTRSGYTFLGWSTNKSAASADSKYAAGECYKGTDGDLILYAIWKGSTTDNPKTGIASHIAAYIAVIALGVGGLVLARKKGLFRQI